MCPVTNPSIRSFAGACRNAVIVLATCLSVGGPANAQTPVCESLSDAERSAMRAAFAGLHPYDGCDSTFEKCLSAKPVADVVVRLASDVCRQIKAGKDIKAIEHALAKRAQSVLPLAKPAAIVMDENTLAGDPSAPVTVVVYACARCPFCSVIVPALHHAITEGSLKGKVRLFFRPFPLKDHEGALDGGLAYMAAAKLGSFWPFLRMTYENFASFDPARLPEWAAAVGLSREDFERECADPKTREALVASKQEGIRNKVDATPTLFVNGRKYVYEMQTAVIVDVLHEAFSSASKTRVQP